VRMKKCPPLVLSTGVETFMPLVDGVIDKALRYTGHTCNQTALQIVQILDLCLVKSVLHNASDLLVDRIKIWVIRLFSLSFTSVKLCEL